MGANKNGLKRVKYEFIRKNGQIRYKIGQNLTEIVMKFILKYDKFVPKLDKFLRKRYIKKNLFLSLFPLTY